MNLRVLIASEPNMPSLETTKGTKVWHRCVGRGQGLAGEVAEGDVASGSAGREMWGGRRKENRFIRGSFWMMETEKTAAQRPPTLSQTSL